MPCWKLHVVLLWPVVSSDDRHMNWCAQPKLGIQQDPCVEHMTLDILWQVGHDCQWSLDKFQLNPGHFLESQLWWLHACSFDFHSQWNKNQFVHRCIGVLDALLFLDECHEYEVQMSPGKSHHGWSTYRFDPVFFERSQWCKTSIMPCGDFRKSAKGGDRSGLSDIHWIPIVPYEMQSSLYSVKS